MVYHGKSEWKYKKFHKHFKNIPEELIPYIPNFSYLLKDLYKSSHQEIIDNYHSIILQTSFLVMKDIFNIFALLENIVEIFRKLYSVEELEFDNRLKTALFYYLYYTNSKENFVQITEEVKQLPNTDKDMISMAEVLIKKGRKEGKLEGKLEGKQKEVERTVCVMLLEDFDLEMIQRITKLNMKRILELQKQINTKGASILDNFED